MATDLKQLKKAFRILRRNYGAPGADGISIRDIKKDFPNNINYLRQCLDRKNYSFTKPYLSTFLDFTGKLRKVYVYNVMDRWIQHYLKLELNPLINNLLQPYTFAYIRGRSNIQASEYVLKGNPTYVLKLDVSDFFQSINSSKLYRLINKIKIDDYLRSLTITSLTDCRNQGLPPGHVLSPMLSNLYMNEFDLKFPINYARYSDDLFFAFNNELEGQYMVDNVSTALQKIDLKLNHKKTKIFKKPKVNDLL